MEAWQAEILARRTLHRENGALVLWHRTTVGAAIVASGFRDVSQRWDDLDTRGVYFSSCPVDRSEGAKGNDLLRVVLRASEQEIDDYELKDPEATFREWCIPAAFINERGSVELWDEYADERGEW